MNRLLPYQTGLCRPLDPFTRYDVVYTRDFPGKNFSVSLRPLHLDRDISLLHSWVKREYIRPAWKNSIPYKEIIQTLVHTAHSDFGQVFTGMHGSRPLCEVQVFRASQDDELGMHPLVKPGDYVLRLMPNRITPAEHLAVIQTAVEFFLRHDEVKRILAIVDEEDARDNKVVVKAGLRLLAQIPNAYNRDNLYVYP